MWQLHSLGKTFSNPTSSLSKHNHKFTDSPFFRFIYELLERAHLTYRTKAEVYEALEQISGYLAARERA